MAEVVALYGWNGSAFTRLAMLWGYSAQYAEHEQNLSTLARDETLTFSTVPAGEVWVVTLFSAWADPDTPEIVSLQAVIGATPHYLAMIPDIAANTPLVMQGQVILAEDDYLQVVFEGCSVAGKIYADAVGYKMSIA